MKYRVRVTSLADLDLVLATDWIAERSPQGAARWFNGFMEAIESLADTADQHGLAPESAGLPTPVRELLYRTKSSTSRALYIIIADEVRVLRIRRPGQDLLRPEELQ